LHTAVERVWYMNNMFPEFNCVEKRDEIKKWSVSASFLHYSERL